MGKVIKFIPHGPKFDAFISEQEKKNLCLIRGMGIDEDDAKDIYQDSSIALYLNIKEGKLTKLTASLSTYFTQICRFQALKHLSKHKKNDENRELEDVNQNVIENVNKEKYNEDCIDEIIGMISDPDFNIEDLYSKVKEVISNLVEPCRTLLWGRFWDRLSHDDLAEIMDYSSANTSKTMLSRCLKKFKLVIEPFVPEELYGKRRNKK